MIVKPHHYTLKELRALPTLGGGQADNLKYTDARVRVWLSRCSVEDGEPYNNKVTVERYNPGNGSWEIIDEYPAVEA